MYAVSRMLDIIIVNWNAGPQFRECIESIVAANCKSLQLGRIVIVDNASSDDSMHNLDNIKLPLVFVRNQKNMGFSAACNQGAEKCDADYFLFLNPDTRLSADSLDVLIRFMEQPGNERIGICGIQLVDEKGRIGRTCARLPKASMFFSKMFCLDRFFPTRFPRHVIWEWDHSSGQIVDQVMGSFFLVRRSLFESLGGFDEKFFVYFEEVDFSLRAHRQGYSSYYLATAQVYYKDGGTSSQIKAKRMFYSLRSRILYGYKHFGWFSATVLLLGTILVEPFSRLALALSRRSATQAKETFIGYKLLLQSLLSVLQEAWKAQR